MTDNPGVDGSEPPGWYPDPKLLSRQRYFDGRVWTSSVRHGADVISDPLGPPPAGRAAWLRPRTTAMLARPNEHTFWRRHRWRVAVVAGAVALCVLVALAAVRPAAAMTCVVAIAVVVLLGARFWSAAALDEQRAQDERWFPRE